MKVNCLVTKILQNILFYVPHSKKICWNAACYTICGISLKISLTARDKRLNKLLQNLEEYLLVSYFSEQDNLYFTVFFFFFILVC